MALGSFPSAARLNASGSRPPAAVRSAIISSFPSRFPGGLTPFHFNSLSHQKLRGRNESIVPPPHREGPGLLHKGEDTPELALWYPADVGDKPGRRIWKGSTFPTRGSGDECRLSL